MTDNGGQSQGDWRSVGAALLGISLATSISAAQIVAVLLAADWAVRSFRRFSREPWIRSPLDRWLAAFYVWALIGFLIQRGTDFKEALTAHDAVILFFLFAHGLKEREVSQS